MLLGIVLIATGKPGIDSSTPVSALRSLACIFLVVSSYTSSPRLAGKLCHDGTLSDKGTSKNCHSEAPSAALRTGSSRRICFFALSEKQILRFTQNDKIWIFRGAIR